MDEPRDAREYDAMDHAEVNRRFVDDLLVKADAAGLVAAWRDASSTADDLSADPPECLDVGTGTAQIPIELCRRVSRLRVVAIDLAASMLHLARAKVEIASLGRRIRCDRVDAKRMPYPDRYFASVISNSIVHHLAEPRGALCEMARVVAPGGLLFVRDLLRPADEAMLAKLVERYAADGTERQRQLFADSLRAALTLEEVRALVSELGYAADEVTQTSDRHWTWSAVRGA